MTRIALGRALDILEARYGKPKPPRIRDPFELILYENASYLVDDEQRAEVFATLEKRIGTTPAKILGAKRSRLLEAIGDGGMRPAMRADKLVKAALIAESVGAPLARVVRGPLAEAKKC